MNKINRSMILTLLISHLAAAFVILMLSIISQPGFLLIDLSFQWIANTALSSYFEYFVPISLTALILSFSIVIDPHEVSTELGGKTGIFHLVKGSIVVFLILTAIFAMIIFVFLPGAHQAKDDAETKSRLARAYVNSAREDLADGKYDDAIINVDFAISLGNSFPEALELRSDIVDRLGFDLEMNNENHEEAPEIPDPQIPTNRSFGELLSLAEKSFAEEDYFSALYFAQQVLGPNNIRDDAQAKQIINDSRAAIANLELDQEESSNLDRFTRKRQGFNAFQRAEYLNAYYIFSDLLEDYPDDQEINRWFQSSLALAETQFFFTDEVQAALNSPIKENVMFSFMIDESITAYVRAGQMIHNRFGTYFIDLEYMELDVNDRVFTWGIAPYGKLYGNHIHTLSSDRNNQDLQYAMNFRTGPRRGVDRHGIPINFDPFSLWSINPGDEEFRHINIAQLFLLGDILMEFGFDPDPAYISILERFMAPFSFISLSFLIIALAWKNRSKYISRPILLLVISSFVFPPVTAGLYLLYNYVYRIILASLLVLSGLVLTIIILVVLQLIQMIIILLYLSGQKLN